MCESWAEKSNAIMPSMEFSVVYKVPSGSDQFEIQGMT